MTKINRPFTEKEKRYIESHQSIIENGELKDLVNDTDDETWDLIYFLVAALKGSWKFIKSEPGKYRLDSIYDTKKKGDPLGLGEDIPLRLILRFCTRVKVDPRNAWEILKENGCEIVDA